MLNLHVEMLCIMHRDLKNSQEKNSVVNLRELGASSVLFAVFAAGLEEARIK